MSIIAMILSTILLISTTLLSLFIFVVEISVLISFLTAVAVVVVKIISRRITARRINQLSGEQNER